MYVIATVICPNFHFSVSLHLPFLNLLYELDSYSKEYLLAKIGVDTAESEPLKVWRKIQFIIHSPPYQGPPRRCPHGPPCDGHQWRLGVDAWERLFDRRHRASPGSLID